MIRGKILGTGSYLPDNIMTNDDLSKLVDTSDEWIQQRTGIKARRISKGETTSDLAYKVALKALESSNTDADEIDLIICATITPDSFMPSTACIVQNKIGAKDAVAFDISAACTGMVYALVTAEQFIISGMYKKILVIGTETLSKIIDWEDRTTCVLFGDGASAVVLGATDKGDGIKANSLYSDGSRWDYLTCKALPLNNPYVTEEANNKLTMEMKGQEVFKFAIRSMVLNINEVLEKANINNDDIKYIIPHQANKRIINQAAKLCKIPEERFYMNLDEYGNTSAASIGIALDELNANKKLSRGDLIILVGFGGGMTSGAILFEW